MAATTHSKIVINIYSHGKTTAEEVAIQARRYLTAELHRNGTSFSIESDHTEDGE